MELFLVITLCCMAASFIADRHKTMTGIMKGALMFLNLLPVLLIMLAMVSIVLFFVPNEILIKYMGRNSGIQGWVIASVLGSIALIPGFIAFPLCNVLIRSGVAYTTIAVFITTLMMVGIITLPVEAKFFGWKTSILRNSLSLFAALLIGFIMMFFL